MDCYVQPNFTANVLAQHEQLVRALDSGEQPVFVGPAGSGVCMATIWEFNNAGLSVVYKPDDVYYGGRNDGTAMDNEIMHAIIDREYLQWGMVPACVHYPGIELNSHDTVDLDQIWEDGHYDGQWFCSEMQEWYDDHYYSDTEDVRSEFFGEFGGYQGSWESSDGTFHYLIPAKSWYYAGYEVSRSELEYNRGFARMNVLDIVMGQTDRHDGNYLFDSHMKKLWMVDNGRIYPRMAMRSDAGEIFKWKLSLPNDTNTKQWQHMFGFSLDACDDIMDHMDEIVETMTDYNCDDASYVPFRARTLHDMLLAAHEHSAKTPSPGMVTVMIGDYRFDETPQVIERWIEEGNVGHSNCNCYKCALIRQYLKERS